MSISRVMVMLSVSVSLSSCGSGGDIYDKALSTGSAHINKKVKFSENAYGVAASPRMTTSRVVRKGGGRRQVGKPYKVKGKWYHPKEEPGYDRKGQASWYGPNFHGRLTANGEIYDQYGLSAAHPTFPLPSYARVTNLDNGRSVVVRVNDRGPYHAKRVIDLSARGAELLGYQRKGIGNVRVQYIKQAPLHGLDHKYLISSFRKNGDTEPVHSKFKQNSMPGSSRFDTMPTGSIKKKKRLRRHGETDSFVRELKRNRRNRDTGSTLSLRLKKQFALDERPPRSPR